MSTQAPMIGSSSNQALPRRDIFIWISTILFLNFLLDIFTKYPELSVTAVLTDLAAIGIFQYIAWYAIFYLLLCSDAALLSGRRDFVIGVMFCAAMLVPTSRIIWVVATGVAIYWYIFDLNDLKLRAAAIILGALSVQELWGHVFFNAIAYPLLCAETAVVGSFLEIIKAGTVWQDNVITGPTGYGIVIFGDCSAFHNLSLAMLCWITISKLRHQTWRKKDFGVASVIGLTMIILNIMRLCLMAWSLDLYRYWHDGAGSNIFAIGASLLVLLASLYGSKSIEERA
jgi:exosortase/archaeosortase family protein